MNRLMRTALVISLLPGLLLGGCTFQQTAPSGSGQGGTNTLNSDSGKKVLRWNMGSEPATLEPCLNSALDASNVINNMFSGLMRERNGKMAPEVAESYELSPDQKTYTFHLKKTYWSDGAAITAQDFVYAWKRALNPATHSKYAFQMFYIQGGQDYYEGRTSSDSVGVRALDDQTLQVTLIAPTSYFLELTAFPCYFPVRQALVDGYPDGSWARDPKVFISNGPFVLKGYTPGNGLVLVKNTHYLNKKEVKLDEIDVSFSSDSNKALSDFESRKLELVDMVPIESVPKLEASDNEFYIFPHIGTHFYYVNVNIPVLKDSRVRRALSLAIDRTALVTTVTKAGQLPATGIVPKGIKDSEGNSFRDKAGNYGIPTDYADVETAKKLLAEAGYPDGKGFPMLEVKVDDNSEYSAIAHYVTSIWEETLGIHSRVTTYPWAELQSMRVRGDYMIARGGWIGDYSDPMTFLDLFLSYSGNNDSHWSNPEFDRLIEEAKLLTGPERSSRLYQAEKLLAENDVIIPLYYLTYPAMVSHRITGWERTGMGNWYLGRADFNAAASENSNGSN